MRVFRKSPATNPLPDAAIKCHEDLWKHIRHLDIRSALTDERVLFILNRMLPFIIMLQIFIIGWMLAQE